MSGESSSPGHVFWLFGLSGAGKSTLALGLAETLRARGISILALDGDVLRTGLCSGLGFSNTDRSENLRRAAEVAKLGVSSGLCVIASFITPLERHREIVAGVLGTDRLSLIFASSSLETCKNRDVKQLYHDAKSGKVAAMTGISSAFEQPSRADLTLYTDCESVETCKHRLLTFAVGRLGFLK